MPGSMEEVTRRLDGLRRRRWALDVGASLLRWLAATVGLLLVALLLARVAPRFVRLLLLAAWIGGIIYVTLRERRRARWRIPTRDEIAAAIEETHPDTRNRLLSALQLHEGRQEAERLGYDPGLLRMSIEGGLRAIESVHSGLVFAVERRAFRNAVLAAAGSTLVFALIASAGGISTDLMREWLLSPRETVTFQIERVEPGDVTVLRGNDVQVTAGLTGAVPSDVYLDLRENGGAWQALRMRREQEGYVASIQNIVAPLEYRIRAKERTSALYTVRVATPPTVESLALRLHFPEYSGLGVKELDANQGDVTALVGTRVTLEGQSIAPLKTAKLDFDSLEDLPLTVDGNRFSGDFVVTTSDRYRIALTGLDELTNVNAPRFVVYAVEDAAPSIAVLKPGGDTTLDDAMQIPIEAEVMDDFGVLDVTLHYRHQQREEDGRIRLKRFTETTPLARVAYTWDLTPLDLFPEDVVTYYVEVRDNDTVNGPKRTVSPTYSVRFPSMTELFDELVASQEAQTEMMGSIADAQDEANDLVDSAIDRLRREQELTLKDRKELERAVDVEKKVERQREALVKEMARSLQEAQKNNLLDLDTIEKVAEMQRLLDEVASEELKQAMRKLQEALEARTPQEQREKLLQASFDQKKFRQRIEQTIKLLEKMKRQQELQKAFQLAEALTQQQKHIVEKTEELVRSLGERRPKAGSDEAKEVERLAEQEGHIVEGAKDLEKQVQKAADALSQDDALQKVSEELRNLAKEVSKGNLQSELSNAQGQLGNQSPQSAQAPATSALKQLQAIRQRLDNAMAFMRGGNGEAIMAALRDAVREMLHLSALHEGIYTRATRMNARRSPGPLAARREMLGDLAVQEQTVAEGVNAVAETLQQLSEEDVQIPLELMWQLADTADAVARSSKAFADNELGRALPIQRQALAALNGSILQMLDTMDQMNAQRSQSGMQNALEQLQQLAEGQGKLNDLAQQIEQMLRQKGRSPGIEQTLDRMAFEQSLIRQAMERLQKQLEQMKGLLGDLSGIGDEMDDVAKRLQAGDLNRDVLERMRRIETRMLESAKALEKRQTGKSRRRTLAQRLFQEQKGPENPEWDAIRNVFEEELNRVGDVQAPEAYRALIRAYYRALAEQKRFSGE